MLLSVAQICGEDGAQSSAQPLGQAPPAPLALRRTWTETRILEKSHRMVKIWNKWAESLNCGRICKLPAAPLHSQGTAACSHQGKLGSHPRDVWIWVHEVGSGSEIIFGIGEQVFRHVWWDLDADTAVLSWHGTAARCQKWNKKSAGSAALGNVQAPAWSHCFSYKLLIFFCSWCDI